MKGEAVDYIITDASGFAVITERRTGRTVIGAPIRGIPGIFAFTQLFSFDTESEALHVIAALEASGLTPEDYTREEGEADGPEQSEQHSDHPDL